MSLTTDLTPPEEARLQVATKREGLEPAALVKKLVKKLVNEHLENVIPIEAMRAQLREWQAQDQTPTATLPPTGPGISPTAALFQQWEAEDAAMTDEERAADEKLWEEVQQGLDTERKESGMRTLF